jgi:hypothetical protein
MFAAVSLSQDSTVLSLRLFLVLSRRQTNPKFSGVFRHVMWYVRPGEKEIFNSAGGVLHPFEAGVGVPTLVIVSGLAKPVRSLDFASCCACYP